ncbi:MAG TPA: hypothetical protein VI258_06265 [Rhodanobacteraceae bacterium]
MRWPSWFNNAMFHAPVLTRRRIRFAYVVAVVTDALQVLLGPFGWTAADELLDVVAAFLTIRLLGFHPLLLPTFLLELVPVADMLPTWTGCVAIVTTLRQRQQPAPPGSGEVIDI